jgi:hypothetical protein
MSLLSAASLISSRLQRTGVYRLPSGRSTTIHAPIVVPDGATLEGDGATSKIVCAGNFPAVKTINSDGTKASRAVLRGFRVSRPNTMGAVAAVQSDSHGLWLWGDDLVVEDVWIENCFNAVYLHDDESDRSNRIRLSRVVARHSNSLANSSAYGLQANTVNGLEVENCSWQNAWLDGIKLRRLCRNVRIVGGDSSENGVSLGQGASGDGIDCFAGGEDVVIDSVLFADNGGNGIVIKTIGLQGAIDFTPSWGWMRQYSIKNVRCRGNAGAGITIEGVYDSTSSYSPTLANAGEDNRPRASMIDITDAVCENNDHYGIFVNGRNVSVKGGVMRSNLFEGIRVGENARDVTLDRVTILGCGTVDYDPSPTRPAVTIEDGAERVRCSRLAMNGKDHGDAVEIVDDSSYAALDTIHRNGVEVLAGAKDVTVEYCANQYVSSDPYASPLVVLGTAVEADRVVLHHEGTETTAASRYFGGPGSTYKSISVGGTGTTVYVKETGAPHSKSGWVAK